MLKRTGLIIKPLVFALATVLGLGCLQAQMRFVENGTQWPQAVKYSAPIPGGRLYVESGGLTFNLYDTQTTARVFAHHHGGESISPPKHLKQHAYRITPAGSNTYAEIEATGRSTTRYAYFLGDDPSKWSGDLHAYRELTYTEIYPGIDWKIYGQGNLKYDFVVAAGADPSLIALAYEGVRPRLIGDGSLLLRTSVADVLESKPYAYQLVDGKKVAVSCTYRIRGSRVGFDLGPYDTSLTLTIDPELIFSTYTGSIADNFGYTATYDIEGHLYSGSTAFGTGYPVTTGAYQTTWAGGTGAGSLPGMDVAISKFNLDGTGLIYSTYLGGSGDEMPHSLIADDSGALYVFGTTGSSDFPTTPDAYQADFHGGIPTVLQGIGVQFAQGSDMFVARLGTTGQTLDGATYLGGTANDGVNTSPNLKYNYADEIRGEIELGPDGEVWVGSCTYSNDFPTTPGAFQVDKGNGQDGMIVRLSPLLQTLEKATFFGGNGPDAVYSIDATPDGKVSVGGGTTSTDLPMPASALQTTNGGGNADGFAATLDSDLSTLENGTYFGSGSYDQIYFIERDAEGSPHVYGQTETEGGQFLQNAAYGQSGRGMVVAKLNTDMTDLVWSTTFGTQLGVPSLSPVAFAVDICNRVYLSGWGGVVNGFGGTSGLDITTDALQTTTDNNDFYFMVLSADASTLDFATYYGGGTSAEHVDGGTSRFDRSGHIYQAVCAGCGGNDDFPIYPADAYSPTNNSSNCNLGVAKIDFDLPLIFAGFEAEDVCLPQAVSFVNTSNTFSGGSPSYHWTFGTGDESFETDPTFTYESPGEYTVQLVISDAGACNISDTIAHVVTVYPALDIELADTVASCEDTTFDITAYTSGADGQFTWSTAADFSTVIAQGPGDSVLTYTPESAGFVYVMVESPVCSALDSVFVSPAPDLSLLQGDTLLCAGDTLEFTAVLWPGGLGPQMTEWQPATAVLSGQNTLHVTVLADTSFTLNVVVTSALGCERSAQADIAVHPILLETTPDTLSCVDDPIDLTANSFGTSDAFVWSTNPDFSSPLNTPEDSVISVVPGAYARYYIRVENQGCVLTDSVGVALLTAGTSVSPDQMICTGDTAVLIVSSDFPGSNLTHVWAPEDLILSGQGTEMIRAIPTETTTFIVESTTPEGCIVENATTVSVSPLSNLAVTATADPQNLLHGESSQLWGLPNSEEYWYQWTPPTGLNDPNSATPTATPNQTTIYTLTINDIGESGICSVSDTVVVRVFESICGPPNIFVPNAFSPNGDGENDVLFVRGSQITDLDFTVFDRWGEKVFETDDLSRGWDGTYKGKSASPAVFVYHLRAVCGDGQKYFEKGNVTLMR